MFSRPLDYKSIWRVRGADTDSSPDTDIDKCGTVIQQTLQLIVPYMTSCPDLVVYAACRDHA